MAYEQASYTQGAIHNSIQVLAGDTYTTRKVIILSGQVMVKGSVIGPVLAAASATVTPGTPVSGSGGTVGNGAVGTWTSDAGAMEGDWRIVITNPATNAGAYQVLRPNGTVDGVGTVGVAYNGGINGTLADGSNDWLEDDYIPITVSYATGLKYKLSLSAATDGSQEPYFVTSYAIDATAGDMEAIVYETAQVNGSGITLGTGHTIASVREGLRRKGILIDD